MEGLVLSQKCVQLLGNLVMWRATELGSEAANPQASAPSRIAGLSTAPPVAKVAEPAASAAAEPPVAKVVEPAASAAAQAPALSTPPTTVELPAPIAAASSSTDSPAAAEPASSPVAEPTSDNSSATTPTTLEAPAEIPAPIIEPVPSELPAPVNEITEPAESSTPSSNESQPADASNVANDIAVEETPIPNGTEHVAPDSLPPPLDNTTETSSTSETVVDSPAVASPPLENPEAVLDVESPQVASETPLDGM